MKLKRYLTKFLRKNKNNFINLFIIIISISFFLISVEYFLSFFKKFDPKTAADPYIGLYNTYPFFTKKNNIATINTKRYPQLFPQTFKIKKAKNTIRIFIFGGSNVYQLSSFKNKGKTYIEHLKNKLKEKYPKFNFEIINCGGNSWGTYHICKLASSVIDLDPDIFIVYSAHNDFQLKIFANNYNLLYVPKWLVTLRTYTAKLRIYSLMKYIFRHFKWKYFSFYKEKLKYSESLKKDYLKIFKNNLSFVYKLAKSHKIKMILCTVPSNTLFRPNLNEKIPDKLKEKWDEYYNKGNDLIKPFISYILEDNIDLWFSPYIMRNISKTKTAIDLFKENSFLMDLSKYEKKKVMNYYKKVFTLENKKNFLKLYNKIYNSNYKFTENEIKKWKKALKFFLKANNIFNKHAMNNFKIGLCYYVLKKFKNSEYFLKQAFLTDLCPTRATPKTDIAIKEVSKKNNIPLVDITSLIKNNSYYNIIGWDNFNDHCHLNSNGKYILINAIDKKIIVK